MAAANPYEEQRRRQMEENKRKLDELRLHSLSAAVRQAAAKPKPTKPPKPRNPWMDAPIRRSGRIASLPEQPDYTARAHRNAMAESPKPITGVTDEARDYAITKAEELKGQLGSDHLTFIRPMSHESATRGTKLCIPMHFRQYLPVHDEMMVLVDELNNDFDVFYRIYNQHQYNLNRWRPFAAEHKLADGDCLVFQLIERRKFKVYIVRASSYNKNDH